MNNNSDWHNFIKTAMFRRMETEWTKAEGIMPFFGAMLVCWDEVIAEAEILRNAATGKPARCEDASPQELENRNES